MSNSEGKTRNERRSPADDNRWGVSFHTPGFPFVPIHRKEKIGQQLWRKVVLLFIEYIQNQGFLNYSLFIYFYRFFAV